MLRNVVGVYEKILIFEIIINIKVRIVISIMSVIRLLLDWLMVYMVSVVRVILVVFVVSGFFILVVLLLVVKNVV